MPLLSVQSEFMSLMADNFAENHRVISVEPLP